ncbi:FHA domain-containing protein [Gordonia sp. NPDC003424]
MNLAAIRAMLAPVGHTLIAIRQWMAAWAPHTRAIVATFAVLWLTFAFTCGIAGGTALLIMSALIIVAAIQLIRGEWRRPQYVSPLTICDNAAQQLHTLASCHPDHHWYLPDIITIELHPADYRELLDQFEINDVVSDLTRETTDVARRYHARTLSGLPTLIQIVPNPAVHAHRFVLTGAVHPHSTTSLERTRPYNDEIADRTHRAATPRVGPVLVGPDAHPYNLVGTDITVGRSTDCDITISADPHVSRHHLTIAFHDGVWWYQDCSSTGVLINGHQVARRTWNRLSDADTLTFGTTPSRQSATFYLAAANCPPSNPKP